MPDCCAGDRLLTLAEAITRALASVRPLRQTETVPLLEAYGRVLAAGVLARWDVPPHDNSAMDGFALHRADLKADQPTRLPVVGQALALYKRIEEAELATQPQAVPEQLG